MNNWPVILIIGTGLLAFAIWYSIRLVDVFNNPEIRRIYIEEIVIPVIPFMIGGYCTWSSLRNGTILSVTTINNRKEKFPLRELKKDKRLGEFENFLKDKLRTRVKINP